MKPGLNKQCTKGRRVSSELNNSELGNAELSPTSDDNVGRINHRVLLWGLEGRNCVKTIYNEDTLASTT